MTSPSPPRLAGLVLAAGASRRFGSPKQLALIDGVPMLQRVIETAQAALPPEESGGEPRSRITVVLGAHAEAVQAGVINRLAPPRPHVVVCPDWESGMAHSLRWGLAALQAPARNAIREGTAPTAAMVMLGDTPYITADDLRRLIDAWGASPETPAAAAYDRTIGAPCILPRGAWVDLIRLRGDGGAGTWLRQRVTAGRAVTTSVIMSSSRDVDVVDDLAPASHQPRGSMGSGNIS